MKDFLQTNFYLALLILFLLISKAASDDCSPHCLSCVDEDYCYECESGYYVDEDDYPVICTPCHKTCKECSSFEDNYCTDCYDGFYLKKNGYYSSCERCPTDNCKTCSQSGEHECSDCLSGFVLSENQCKKCHSSCLECSGTEDYQCTKCPNGFIDQIQDETKHYCISCDPNCITCENSEKCSQCKEGYFKNGNGKCIKCHSSCQNCNGETSSHCTQCKEGFFLSGKECTECDTKCKACEGTKDNCTKCREGQYIDHSNSCSNCAENCKACNSPTDCTTCIDGFLLDRNGICVTCGADLHCKKCRFVSSYSSNKECLECADDSYVSHMYQDNTVVCSACPDTCLTCYDKDFCTSCISRYFLYKDKCEKCADGCLSCKDTSTFCTSCLPGFRMNENTCVKCPDGCLECESDTVCSSCSNGFYLNNKLCTKCDVSCRTCNDGTNKCTECAAGYVFDDTDHCIKCPPNCTLCDKNGCYDCDPEFYPLEDGTCAPCSDVCFECTGPTENDCYECDPGFYFDRKLRQCIECDPACKTCDGPRDSNCVDCAVGYWHTTKFDYETYEDIPICGPCEFACAECTDDEICTVCNDGFRLYDGISSPDCEACQKGCKRCDEAKNKCTECLDTFYVSSRNEKYVNCSSCPSNCRKCSKDDSGNLICNECLEGFYKEDNKCVKCNSPCATCTSATHCTSCVAGHLYDGAGSCDVECSPDCQTCERTQSTCLTCHSGYYIINNTCVKCPLEGCKKCIIGEHAATCRECLDGYYKDEFFESCYECNKACATCAEGSNKYCLSCSVGYYVSSTSGNYLTCSPCSSVDPNCLECNNNECDESGANCNFVCSKCAESYSYVNGKCAIICHESCKECDGSTEKDCLSCNEGYYFDKQESGRYCKKCGLPDCQVCSIQNGAVICMSCIEDFELNKDTNQCTLKSQICDGSERCDLTEDKIRDIPTVRIRRSEFNNIKSDKEGGAISLTNHAIQVIEAKFTHCETTKGGGCIYYRADKVVEEPTVFDNLVITDCKATYGGAIYAFSDKEENLININSCTFERCEAASKPTDSSNGLFGGAAVYLQVKNGVISNCIFIKNKGNNVKVDSLFDSSSKLLGKSSSSSFVSIKSCHFEAEKHSSLYFIDSDNDDIPLELKDCTFAGNLPNGVYHIDGISGKKKNLKTKLRIEDCKFSSNSKSAINANVLELLSNSFDNNNSQNFNLMKSEERSNYHEDKLRLINVMFVSLSAFIVIIVIIISIGRTKISQEKTDDNENVVNQKEL